MARITHVAKAQQKYRMVPVLNEDGSEKQTPVIDQRTNRQKTDKRGRPVFMKVTVVDKTQPLPLETCDAPGCGKPIEVGTPYKWVQPKSGPYGGRKRSRHESCPTWHQWELSNSTSARIAQIVYDAEQDTFDDSCDADDMRATLESAAEAIRELAQEKIDAADNMESGFGHATEQSDEIRQLGEDLESWASDVENADIPEKPEEPSDGEPGEEPDDQDSADWRDWEQTRDEWDEYQTALEQWVDEVIEARDNVLGESPA